MAKTTSNVGELNAHTVTVRPKINGAPSLPSTAHWRMTCPDDDDAEIVAWTSATVSTGVGADGYTADYYITITIPATAHAMATDYTKERRLLIVSTDKGLATEQNEEWQYYVEKRSARS